MEALLGIFKMTTKKEIVEQYGFWSRRNNGDGSMSIYRHGVFIAAVENTTASCRLFYEMAQEIDRLVRYTESCEYCSEAIK